MSDLKFVKIPNLKTWVVFATMRSKVSHIGKKGCIFCPESKQTEAEVYRIPEGEGQWRVRVVKNKYPFAPIHEIVILTPDHNKLLSDSSIEQVKFVIGAYVNRYNAHKKDGTVVIFGNSGHDGGASVDHAHAQIAVVPDNVDIETPKLARDLNYTGEHFQIGEFKIICPPYSQWPDEVWVIPLDRKKNFGEITYKEIESLSYIWHRLIKIFEIRHGHKFPHNFYIYPFSDWYLRIIPRAKMIGGFEISTGIFVNTQDPSDTMKFIKDHFAGADEEKIKKSRARYRKGV